MSRRNEIPDTSPQLCSNDTDADGAPLDRLLCAANRVELIGLALMVNEAMAAALIAEPQGPAFGIVHFMKADYASFPGSSEALLREASRDLLGRGIRTVNFGSDDGVPGLRAFKQRLMPIGFVEKYTVRRAGAGQG
jgi:hypothetical protein